MGSRKQTFKQETRRHFNGYKRKPRDEKNENRVGGQKKNRFLLRQQKDEMGQKDPYTQVHVTKQKYLHFKFA